MEKACKICGTVYQKKASSSLKEWNKSSCCSRPCFHKHYSIIKKGIAPKNVYEWCHYPRNPKLHTCAGCKTEFQARKELNGTKTKYCTRECYLKYYGVSQKGRPLNRHGYKHSVETIEKIRISNVGKKRPYPSPNLGKKRPETSGEKNSNWKGGVSKINRTERENFMSTVEYKSWRRSVYTRDSYTCQICNERGVKLNADHIKPYSLYPDLRLEVSNGRTLCVPCHKEHGYNFFRDNNPHKKKLETV